MHVRTSGFLPLSAKQLAGSFRHLFGSGKVDGGEVARCQRWVRPRGREDLVLPQERED